MKKLLFLCILILPISLFSQQNNTKKNKVKTYYYIDNVICREFWYGNDDKIDSLKTYYKNGTKNEVFYYKNNKFEGAAHQFNKLGELIVTWNYKKGKLIDRIDHKIEFHKNNEKQILNAHIKLEQAEQKLKDNPNNKTGFIAFYQKTHAQFILGNTTLALKGFKKIEKYIIKLAKKNKKLAVKKEAAVYDILGSIYTGYEMQNLAIHYRFKALKTSPTESRLYYNFGSYLAEIKSYRLAQVYINKAIELVPNHSFANWSLANVYTDLKQYDKAMECIQIAFKGAESIYKLNQGTEERDLLTTRGYLYHKLGETEKGIKDLQEALLLNKNNSYALRNLGEIYYDLEQYNKACGFLQKAKNLGYEKIHDKNDLNYFLSYACENKTASKTLKITDVPYAYPNPVIDKITIKNIATENFNYKLYNYNSQLILEGKANNKSIDISTLNSGLYILNIENNDTTQSLKIIKE